MNFFNDLQNLCSISTVQSTFLLPSCISRTPQQRPWSMPVMIPTLLQNHHLSCLPPKPSLIHTQLPQIPNETEPASQSSLEESMQTPDVSEHRPCSLQCEPSLVSAIETPQASSIAESAVNQSAIQSSNVLENQSTKSLSLGTAITKGEATFPELFFLKKDYNREVILEVTPRRMHYVSGSGHTSVARITFSQAQPSGFNYDLQIL